jgi:hypothetical protein
MRLKRPGVRGRVVVESRLFSARFSQAQRLLQIEIAATPELAWLVDSRETRFQPQWHDANHLLSSPDLPAPLCLRTLRGWMSWRVGFLFQNDIIYITDQDEVLMLRYIGGQLLP